MTSTYTSAESLLILLNQAIFPGLTQAKFLERTLFTIIGVLFYKLDATSCFQIKTKKQMRSLLVNNLR